MPPKISSRGTTIGLLKKADAIANRTASNLPTAESLAIIPLLDVALFYACRNSLPRSISEAVISQRMIGHGHRAPHMGRGAVVVTQALLGLLEMAADDVGELLQLGIDARLEGVKVVHRHQPGIFIPFVIAHHFVGGVDIGL